MNVPDFSGLTGKELVRAHRARRNAETEKDAWADDIRFAGLTQTRPSKCIRPKAAGWRPS